MKRIYYFLKSYIADIITALVGVFGVAVAWRYGTTISVQQSISLAVVVLSLLAIIYFRSRQRGFIFSPLTWRKDKEPWVGYGTFQFVRVQKAYEITNADPGYIHSEILAWSDYKLSFDFKIAHWGDDGGLGVIVRANNLANYIMLQIKRGGVGPHIRINSGWAVWQPTNAGLEFSESLSLDRWFRCDVYCDKSTITIRLHSGKDVVFDRVWEIPRGPLIFSYKHSDEDQTVNIPFPITLEYGSVGFREHDIEKAFVKNILVEKL